MDPIVQSFVYLLVASLLIGVVGALIIGLIRFTFSKNGLLVIAAIVLLLMVVGNQ